MDFDGLDPCMKRQECEINISREIFQAWLRNQEFVRVLEEADASRPQRVRMISELSLQGVIMSPERWTCPTSLSSSTS